MGDGGRQSEEHPPLRCHLYSRPGRPVKISSQVHIQFLLPYAVQFWNCEILGRCESGKSTALTVGISILPDLNIYRDGETSELSSIVIKKDEFEEASPAVAKEAFAAVTVAQNYRESGNLKKVPSRGPGLSVLFRRSW